MWGSACVNIVFFKIGGCCVDYNNKIFVLLDFFLENLRVISKTRKHKNHRTVSHIFLPANDILKKMWRSLRIQPKFSKFLEMYYRGKLQYLQGTTSYKGTTNLRRLTVNWGNDRFFYFHKFGWSGNKLKHLGAGYMGSFIPPSRDKMF